MGKFSEIYEGWKNVIYPNDRVEIMASERLKICNECEYKTHINTCGLCGCPLISKVRSDATKCPSNKWEPIKINE